jgi:hypothetical protein
MVWFTNLNSYPKYKESNQINFSTAIIGNTTFEYAHTLIQKPLKQRSKGTYSITTFSSINTDALDLGEFPLYQYNRFHLC